MQFKWLIGILCLLSSVMSWAKVETSSLFVHLSDALQEVKNGDAAQSRPYLLSLEQEFIALPSHHSEAGQAVQFSLKSAIDNPTLAHLEQLSKALYRFEKEQNPVDYQTKRQQFAKRLIPAYQRLADAVTAADFSQIQTAYKGFNSSWSLNEKVVRETSLGHYGQIETAMSLFRIALLSTPMDSHEMQVQLAVLQQALTDFIAGNIKQPQSHHANAPTTLAQGIALLEKSYQSLTDNQLAQAKDEITLFIQQWAIFEGEVRTRDAALYTKIESELPLIMAKGNDAQNRANFQALLDEMKHLDPTSRYSFIDAMLILLREGVEALLIIMALLTTLKVANQPNARRWVYLGAGLGLTASLLGAIALQQLFPALSAGTNREILEGAVGIVAVGMMLFVGAWLHSKATLAGWSHFLQKQVNRALATGSLMSMMSLSFLSVFREGAETILFYAGILPLIKTSDLLLGIGLALAVLAMIALLMNQFSMRLPIHHLFKLMTLLIYALGFKILGVSINALQLTQVLPRDLIESLPNIPWLGFYSSWQGVATQALYLLLIPLVAICFKHRTA